MGDIIDIGRNKFRSHDNLIVGKPLELRVGDWRTGYVLMCTRNESQKYEEHRAEALRQENHRHIGLVPNHFTLDDGCHYTMLGLYRHRSDEALMRRVYRLAGLMECVTGASSPVLRTDLLRRFYKTILDEREALNLTWRGSVSHFLFPFHPELRNPNLFLHAVSAAETLKDLYDAVERETETQFNILADSYVFYLPESLAGPDTERA